MALKDLIETPTYKIKLPSTKKEITYRPFLVKEEKILLIAKESKDLNNVYDAMKRVMENCIVEPNNINIDSLPYYDAEYLYIHLRSKSMGEKVEILVTDPKTKQKIDAVMDINEIYVENLTKNNKKIKLNDNLFVELNHPTFGKFKNMASSLLKESVEDNKNSISVISEILVNCINKIYSKNKTINCSDIEKEEIIEFLDNLKKEEFQLLTEFINEFPKLKYNGKALNPYNNNKEIEFEVDNFKDFFI